MSLPQSKYKVGMGIVLDRLTEKADVSVGKYEEAGDGRDSRQVRRWGSERRRLWCWVSELMGSRGWSFRRQTSGRFTEWKMLDQALN